MGDYLYRSARDYARALVEYDLAEQSMAGSSVLLESRAYIQRRLGLWEESLAAMDRAIELDPRNVNLHFNQALTYVVLRDYAQADRHYERVLEISPDHAIAYIWRSRIPLKRDGDVAALRDALDNAPFDLGDWRYFLSWTGAIYERDYMAALDVLNTWGSDAFDDFNIFASKSALYGVTYRLAGRNDDAEIAFWDAT